MSLINFILDVAGLLLWLSWRSIRFDPLFRATPATLAGTVRRAEASRWKRWHFLGALACLLIGRALFNWQIGSAVDWTPQLDLGVVALAFRGHVFFTALLFSLSSFVRAWVVFHFWLMALAFINGPAAEPNPIQKLILLQLGRFGRWPPLAQVLLPGLFAAALWLAAYPLLAYAEVIHRAQSIAHVLAQGAVIGTAVYFTLKNLLPVFLFLHLIATYVYLGNSPLWDYISATSRQVLVPLNRLPLRWGRVDFAPLVGIILLLLLLHALPNLVLTQLSRRNLTIWPQ